MQIDEKALVRAVKRAMENAGTLPAKEAVKLVPADWHRICDLALNAPLESAKPKEAAPDTLMLRELLAQADEDDLYREVANRLGLSWIAPNCRSYGPSQPSAINSAAGGRR